MKIAVLDFTRQTGDAFADVPTVGETLIDWLAPAMPAAQLVVVPVAYGAALPSPGDFDGYLLSGSELGVYDAPAWMAPTRAFLRAARAAGKPMFGICFGHQLMADEFGGKAEKAACGNQIGVRRYEMGGAAFDTQVWHGDQVTRVPPGATVTGRAAYCPVGALVYDFPAMSVQFHPEYSRERLEELWGILADELDCGEVAAALASQEGVSVSKSLMAREAADFFCRHVRGET